MPAYKIYDFEGVEIHLPDLQDKGPWCLHGLSKELVFVQKFGQSLGFQMNPQKNDSVYAPDLVDSDGNICDLKTQNTPFFSAQSFYGLNPHTAVTFNQKDWERYSKKYPTISIVFWVEWLAARYEKGDFKVKVNRLTGVWKISLSDIAVLIKKVPLHSYGQRRFDTSGNARSSYVFDLNHEGFKRLV